MDVSVGQAAASIGVDRSRVLRWLRSGHLAGRRLGREWLVDEAAVAVLAGQTRRPGRPMAPARAWGLLDMLDGGDAPWLAPVARSQVRALLRELASSAPDAARWRSLLRGRAAVVRASGHPAALARLQARMNKPNPEAGPHQPPYPAGPALAALAGIDLVVLGALPHLYVPADQWPALRSEWHLSVATDAEPGLIVHVPAGVWPFDRGGQVGDAAICADLLDEAEPRAVSGALNRLHELTAPFRLPRNIDRHTSEQVLRSGELGTSA